MRSEMRVPSISRRFDRPTPILKTARLVLRPPTLDDAPAIQRQFERFEVVRYLNKTVPWPYPPDGASYFLEQVLQPCVDAGREQAWVITLDSVLIGFIHLVAAGDENRGFWLTPEYWGRGLMREASDRVTDYAMDELGWDLISSGNAASNVASSRVKQSQGFVRMAVFLKEFVGGTEDYEQWTLTREVWLSRKS